MIKLKKNSILILAVVGLVLPSLTFATGYTMNKSRLGSSNGFYQYMLFVHGHGGLPFRVKNSTGIQGPFSTYHTSILEKDFIVGPVPLHRWHKVINNNVFTNDEWGLQWIPAQQCGTSAPP